MKITAVIPVRAGSTRVKDKNIRRFSGSSLLEIKIEQLKRIPEIDDILVSSDSLRMLEIAREHGVRACRRPDEYCDEKTRTFGEAVQYIAETDVGSGIMMWAPCVCPCLTDEKIREGIALYEKIRCGLLPYDSVASAVQIKEYLFDETGPVNFTREHHVPSQQLPDWHYVVNCFFIAGAEDMARWRFVYGEKPCLCEVSKLEGIDIDDQFDFDYAEYAYNKFCV